MNAFQKYSFRLFQWQAGFCQSQSAVWLLAVWSCLEAISWFVLPDFLLLLLAIGAPHRWRLWVLVSVGFSLLGAAIMLGLLSGLSAAESQWIFRLPFTSMAMLGRLDGLVETHGLLSLLVQPFSGVPLKVWLYAGVFRYDWPAMAVWFLVGLSRSVRMLTVAGLGVLLAQKTPGILQRGWLLWLVLYTVVFFWGLYRTSL